MEHNDKTANLRPPLPDRLFLLTPSATLLFLRRATRRHSSDKPPRLLTQRPSARTHPRWSSCSRGDHAQGSSSRRNGDAAPLPVGLCSVCEGEGEWLAAGSGAGQVLVFDKRRPGGRPLFWWNAHGGVVVGIFHVAR